jgi:hypothetical protein
MFQQSKVPTKIYTLSRAHILLKINIPHTNSLRPAEDHSAPGGGVPHSLGTSALRRDNLESQLEKRYYRLLERIMFLDFVHRRNHNVSETGSVSVFR